jgi:hypothetical protein
MALEISYNCGHHAKLESEKEGNLSADRACLGCAIRKLELPADGKLDSLFSALDDSTMVLRSDAQGAISIGTSNGLFDLVREEATRRNLQPHQLMVLATLRLLSTPEEILARGFSENPPPGNGSN